MMMTQAEKARVFRDLHRGHGAFVMPNPWDAGSARLLESLGFKALATTSAGIAYGLGRPDGENAVTRAENLENSSAICSATSLPVSGDLEGGFGDRPEDCAEAIRLAAKAGLVGGSIEDATGVSGKPIYDFGHAVERVKVAVESARSLDFHFTLTARAENFIQGNPDLKDTIRRLQAFQEAGADVLFAPGIKTEDDIKAVVSSVDRPLNVVMGLVGVPLTVSELAALGVRRISVGGSLVRAAYGAAHRAAQEIASDGSFSYSAEAIPDAELTAFFSRRS